MMDQFIKFTLICVIFLPFISMRHVEFFRKDYTYIQEFDAFYKLHWDSHGLSWESAFLACDDEGATLFYPKVKDEWALVKNLTNEMAEASNVTEIFVGLHDDFGLGEFMTVDGHSTPSPLATEKTTRDSKLSDKSCLLMNINTGLFKEGSCVAKDINMPFAYVCKKVESESCPTIDKGYKYIKASKKCYKVNNRLKTWNEAMRTCYMEGALLTVIEDLPEADSIRVLLTLQSTYHVGIRRMFSGSDYYTVKGQKFDDVYQQLVTENYDYGDRVAKDCGAILYSGNYLYTTYTLCSDSLPFVCEMEVDV